MVRESTRNVSKRNLVRWKAVCAYDGGKFHGWQSQQNAVGVQDVIEEALAAVFGRSIRVHGSGRTDSGVHALGQVFHFDAEWPHRPDQLLTALRTRTPKGLQVQSIRRVRSDFHARFDAVGKRYHYRIFLGHADPFEDPFCWSVPSKLDVDRMREAAKRLSGRHDFIAFSAWNGDVKETTIRDLRRFEVQHRGPRIRIVLEADGFLYKMVRTLAGTLVAIGAGRLSVDDAASLLITRQRVPAAVTAPARGLFLEKVLYHK